MIARVVQSYPTFFAALYAIAAFMGFFGFCFYLVAPVVHNHNIEQQNIELAQKANCVRRGGTVTEYHGGLVEWACERQTDPLKP